MNRKLTTVLLLIALAVLFTISPTVNAHAKGGKGKKSKKIVCEQGDQKCLDMKAAKKKSGKKGKKKLKKNK